jgi:hypothetical protein
MLQIKRHAELAFINRSSCLLVMSTSYRFVSNPDTEKHQLADRWWSIRYDILSSVAELAVKICNMFLL